MKVLLGRARAKKGMFEGDMTEGELELGNCFCYNQIKPAAVLVDEIVAEFKQTLNRISSLNTFPTSPTTNHHPLTHV